MSQIHPNQYSSTSKGDMDNGVVCTGIPVDALEVFLPHYQTAMSFSMNKKTKFFLGASHHTATILIGNKSSLFLSKTMEE